MMSLLQKSQKTKKMSEKDLFLGIDTSNYTTSVALCNDSGKVILNLKKLLPVKAGSGDSDKATRSLPTLKIFPR